MAREDTIKSNQVNFERFQYDVISMFGLNLFYITEGMLEVLLRHIFRHISYNFDDRVRLRCFEHVEEAFTEAELAEVSDHKRGSFN